MKQTITTAEEIGAALQMRRKELNLTQDDLTSLVGVGRKFISSVENGKATAQIGLVLDLCRDLGIRITLSTDDLFPGPHEG